MELSRIQPTAYSRRICDAIRHIFLEIWDPIGIRDEPNAQDEYDSYVERMFELLTTDVPDAVLLEYLDQIVNRMGMDASRHSHADVLQALRRINLRDLQRYN